jgi:hypothetical protein
VGLRSIHASYRVGQAAVGVPRTNGVRIVTKTLEERLIMCTLPMLPIEREGCVETEFGGARAICGISETCATLPSDSIDLPNIADVGNDSCVQRRPHSLSHFSLRLQSK